MAYLSVLLLVSMFLQQISSVPTTGSPKCTSEPLATFDDIFLPNPTGPTTPVGTYRHLNFPGFTVGRFLSASPVGVVPQSGNQYAVFNSETRVLTASPVSAITVKNAGSAATSFTLSRFYYGCAVASQEGLVGVAASCVVTATAYSADGKVLGTQKFPYQFTNTKQGLALATPDAAKFKNVYRVEFLLEGGVAENTAKVGLLDSISLQTCS